MAYYIRHLSAGETISDMMHSYGADLVLHAGLIQSKVPITRQTLDHAVSILVKFQPALNICITSEKTSHGKGSHFVLNNVTHDVDVIEADNRKAWVGIAEVELSRPFNSLLGPLWKVKFVRFGDTLDDATTGHTHEGALLFTIHQALVDGVCMFDLLYRQLIAILNCLLDHKDMSKFQTPLALLPPTEVAFTQKALNPSKNSFKEPSTLKKLTEKDQPLFRPLFTCLGDNKPNGPSVTRLLPFILPAGATKELIEKCYRNRISPKSVLITAAAMSLGITAAKHRIRLGEALTVCLPIDLRHYNPMPQPQPLGNWLGHDYINIVKQTNFINLKFFWNDATKIHQNLLQQREGWLNLTNSKSFFDHHRKIMKKIAKEQTVGPTCHLHKAHFSLYDLGNCDLMTGDLPEDEDYDQASMIGTYRTTVTRVSRHPGAGRTSDSVRMSEHFFTSSMSDVTTIPLSLGVCTYRGTLMWTLAYNRRWITKSFAVKFIDGILEIINQLVADAKDFKDMFSMSPNNNPHPPDPVPFVPPVPISNSPYPRQANPRDYEFQSGPPDPVPFVPPVPISNSPYPRQANPRDYEFQSGPPDPVPPVPPVPITNSPYPGPANPHHYEFQSGPPDPVPPVLPVPITNSPYPRQQYPPVPYPAATNHPYPQQQYQQPLPSPPADYSPYPQYPQYPPESNIPPAPHAPPAPPPPPPPPPPPNAAPPAGYYPRQQPYNSPPSMGQQGRPSPRQLPSGSMNRPAEDINKLPPFIRMQRMKMGDN